MAEVEPIPESDQVEGAAHPREARSLIGQGDASEQFLSAWGSGRLPHAWLLGGRQGVGKATFAYHAARALLRSPDKPPGLPDFLNQPADDIFERVNARGHGNLITLRRPWDPKTKRFKTVLPIDEVRRTGMFFRQTASESGWRICIIDTADEMNRNAANALLKILEEPPERALFLVLSHTPSRLLPTIRSRCRSLRFSSLTNLDITEILSRVGAGNPSDELLQLAEGSAGQALWLSRAKGIALYEALCQALLDPGSARSGALAFSQRFTGKETNQYFSMFTEFLKTILLDCTRMSSRIEFTRAVTNSYRKMIINLSAQGPLDCWPALWDKASRLASEAEMYNLSRPQTALVILDHISDNLDPARKAG